MIHDKSSISTTNALEKPNEVVALCVLDHEENRQNRVILTQQYLRIIREDSHIDFTIGEIVSVQIIRVKLLLYVIIGGIVAPMSLLAISERLLDTSLLLLIFVAALGVLMYGMNGVFAIKVTTRSHHQVVPLTTQLPRQALLRFIQFVEDLLPQLQSGQKELVFYASRNASDRKFRLQSTFPKDDYDEILRINLLALTASVELLFENNQEGMFASHINKQSVLETIRGK